MNRIAEAGTSCEAFIDTSQKSHGDIGLHETPSSQELRQVMLGEMSDDSDMPSILEYNNSMLLEMIDVLCKDGKKGGQFCRCETCASR